MEWDEVTWEGRVAKRGLVKKFHEAEEIEFIIKHCAAIGSGGELSEWHREGVEAIKMANYWCKGLRYRWWEIVNAIFDVKAAENG